MANLMNAAAERRMSGYFDRIGRILGRKGRRESFALYAEGILGDGERKSIEPIAARACADPARADAEHQRLLHFALDAPWSDDDVRREAARYAIDAMTAHEPVDSWIIDDTGFLKQGKHSVGVQRQYTGSAGKTTNCQIGVSLSIATDHAHLPIDFELFLPESWTNDPKRRQAAGIPEDKAFKTKIDLALEMIERAARDGIPGDILLADSFYGHSQPFRDAVHLLGFDYGVAIYASDKMYLVGPDGAAQGELRTAKEIGLSLERGAYRRYTWREGTGGSLSSRFALCRVAVPSSNGKPQ